MTSHQPVVSAETRSRTHRNSSSRQKRATQDGTDTHPNVLTPEQEDSLGTLVGEVMACEHIPGLALGISKGGKRQSEGYGVADMETGRPVDSNTLFGIGSNTKAFTAATLSQLMLTAPTGKKFTWDTPLTEILKDFQMPDHTRTASTTLTDVLSHQTGLASADVGFFAGFPLNMTTSDFASRLRFLPEVYPYRDKWHYSNMVYGVLTSLVCETVAATTWTKLVRDVICDPLGMNNTVVTSDALQLDHVALPYILRMTADDMFVQQDLRLFNLHPLEATAALMSSASDMTLWMEHLLLALNNASTATQFAVKDTFADRVLLPPDYKRYLDSATQAPVEYMGFSLGWMSVKYRNTTIYEHRGDFFGYSSSVIVAPEHNMAVFMATNGPNSNAVFPALAHLSHYVLDVLQGRDPWVNVSILCPMKKGDDDLDSRVDDNADYDALDKNDDYDGSENTKNMKLKKFLRPVEDYLGTYGHGLLGNLHITRQEKRGTLRMELGRHLVADLIPTDQESVLSAVTRGPLADTKEWEKARPLVFIMARKGKATASSRHDTSVDGQADVIEKENREGNRSLAGSIAISDKRSFTEVHLAWGIEVYVFKRGILFETALTKQESVTTMQDVEGIDEPMTSTVTIDEPMTSTVTIDEPMTSTVTIDEPMTSTAMTDEPLTSTAMTDEPLTSTAAMFENTSLSAAAISRDASNGSSYNTVKALIVITFLFLATSVL
ncbi:uncharacterized protein LOC112560245 isoform X2 [Pomacea canaliculata]|uniref:uncharacterized protein LOC112560245 isoform X2 n=1 Tax=Pomacea canaliculata TaxID=400727 RepID=UPI000D733B1B|nr:uncharacterized protein LOC112560245 isoform X2 [Pomacea canaliculata]